MPDEPPRASLRIAVLSGCHVEAGGRPVPEAPRRRRGAGRVVKLLALTPGHRVALVRERLLSGAARLVTLTGPGGVGKLRRGAPREAQLAVGAAPQTDGVVLYCLQAIPPAAPADDWGDDPPRRRWRLLAMRLPDLAPMGVWP